MPPTNSVLLSDAVLERLPFLRNANVRFFDFGNVLILDHSTAGETTKVMGKSAFSAVVVITDEVIALASFPMNSNQSSSLLNSNPNYNNNNNSNSHNNDNTTSNQRGGGLPQSPSSQQQQQQQDGAAPFVIPHTSIVGVSREGASVLLRNSFMNDIKLTLPKTEAFIVHLIGIQDRGMNRTLRLAGGEAGTSSSNNNNMNGNLIDDDNNKNNNSNNRTANATSNNNNTNNNNKSVTFGNFPLGMNIDQQDPSDPNAVRRAMSLAEDLSHGSAAAEASMERLWGVIRLGRGSSRAGPPTTELDEGSDASSVQTIQHIADSPREHDDDDDGGGDHHDDGYDGDHHRNDDEDGDGTNGRIHHRDPAKVISREEAQVPPMITDAASLKRRLWYFFMYYDQSRLQYIDTLVSMHQGTDGKALMKDLEQQYGPEPHRFRWSIRDQTIYQREINSQLRAQLARAQDELLLLKENPHEKETAVQRVLRRKQEIMNKMMMNDSPTKHQQAKNVSFSPDTKITSSGDGGDGSSPSNNNNNKSASWQEMFNSSSPSSSSSLDRSTLKGAYHVLSFHEVADDSNNYRPQFEWTVISVSNFWSTVKQQVAGGGGLSGPLRSTRPLIEITNEDCREMLVCNRDFFLAWLAEAHGDCVMHVRHVDGSFCFMSLAESFRNVKLGI